MTIFTRLSCSSTYLDIIKLAISLSSTLLNYAKTFISLYFTKNELHSVVQCSPILPNYLFSTDTFKNCNIIKYYEYQGQSKMYFQLMHDIHGNIKMQNHQLIFLMNRYNAFIDTLNINYSYVSFLHHYNIHGKLSNYYNDSTSRLMKLSNQASYQ